MMTTMAVLKAREREKKENFSMPLKTKYTCKHACITNLIEKRRRRKLHMHVLLSSVINLEAIFMLKITMDQIDF